MNLPNLSVADHDDYSSDEDLNDFNALKSKTTNKQHKKGSATVTTNKNNMAATMGSSATSPRTIERDVVIDDFIRNFLTKVKMTKTMNIF